MPDYTTINGKTCKNATISRVEADGIVLRTKMEFPRSISLNSRKIFSNGFITLQRRRIAAQRQREPITGVLLFIIVLHGGSLGATVN